MKIKAATIMLLGFVACTSVMAKPHPVNLGKSLIRAANPGALSMPGMPGMPTTFPNNYNSVISSMSYDPNVGSAGTLYATWNFTGTTLPNPMCSSGAHHFPALQVIVRKSGVNKSVHDVSGSYVAPCVQMNQNLTIAFDLGSDQCQLSLFIDGTCALYEQEDSVTCTIAGEFVFLLKNTQFEYAALQLLGTYPNPPAPGQNLTVNCLNVPDWQEHVPTWTYAPNFGHDFYADSVQYRTAPVFQSFKGQSWHYITQYGPIIDAPAPGSQPCDNYDLGIEGPPGPIA